MKRISDENGSDAGLRNFGRFWLMAIPLVLGLGASAWLGFYIGAHQFRRELSQEDRAAVFVGATERPKSKMVIDATSAQKGCAGVTRADLDGSTLRLYVTNDCQRNLNYIEYHYQLLSPNGTVLHHGYENTAGCPVPRLPKDKAECVFTGGRYGYGGVEIDDRVASMRVWTEVPP